MCAFGGGGSFLISLCVRILREFVAFFRAQESNDLVVRIIHIWNVAAATATAAAADFMKIKSFIVQLC